MRTKTIPDRICEGSIGSSINVLIAGLSMWNNRNAEPIKVDVIFDSTFGSVTRTLLAAFQTGRGLVATGFLNQETNNQLALLGVDVYDAMRRASDDQLFVYPGGGQVIYNPKG